LSNIHGSPLSIGLLDQQELSHHSEGGGTLSSKSAHLMAVRD